MRAISRGLVFFCLVLLLIVVYYLVHNLSHDIDALSSDVWSYQMLEMQKHFAYWSNIPPSYNQSELFIAFPLFYLLNPGLEGSLFPYHALAVLLIALTYLVNGFVIFKIFKSWWLAAVAGILLIVPRYVFPTRIGILSLEQLRANTFVFPSYLILTYYWILFGLRDRKQNIALGTLAGLCVYLYPPTALTTVAFGSVTAALVHWKRREYLKEIGVFLAAFFVFAFPFALNHVLSKDTGMIDTATLSNEQQAIQVAAINRAFAGNVSASSVEFEEMKRIVWDQTPMLGFFLLSLVLVRHYRRDIPQEIVTTTLISIYLFLSMCAFVIGVEALNWYAASRGMPPVFIEHLRILRGIGFISAVQFAVFLYIVASRWRASVAAAIAIAILVTPIYFFAPILRTIVRATVPESIRLRFNLAPIEAPGEIRDFQNLKAASVWARSNLPDSSKIFVFSDYQREFQFKVLSHHDTSSTKKEGNLWATTGFENARMWLEERTAYDNRVKSASDFANIVAFAREIGCTHMLLPKGTYADLYDSSATLLPALFTNTEYRILEL